MEEILRKTSVYVGSSKSSSSSSSAKQSADGQTPLPTGKFVIRLETNLSSFNIFIT